MGKLALLVFLGIAVVHSDRFIRRSKSWKRGSARNGSKLGFFPIQGIQACLDQLSDDFRVVVVLVDVQGLDYLEASEIIGKPLGTIKSRLARARNRMRDCLQGFWELLPHAMRLES